MKKIAKKIIAIMCILSLVSAFMPKASKLLNMVEASDNEYTELTFCDFGMEDTTFEGGTSGVKGTAPATVTSLDKVIISGKIKVTSHIDEHFLIGGAADAGDYNASTPGLVLSTLGTDSLMIRWQYNGQKGAEYYPFTNPTLTSKGINLVGDEIILKFQFDYVGEDVNVTLTLDNGTVSASETVTFSGIASKLTTNLAFNPWLSKCKIASVEKAVTPEEPVGEYKELTFSDFGMEDTTFEGGTSGVKGTAPATVTSLDKVIISGKIKVTSHIDEHFLIGGAADAGDYNASTPGLVLSTLGTDSLMIRWQYNGQKGAEYYPFTNPTLTSKGINLVGDEIILKFQFDYVGEDVNVTLTLDNGTVSASETVTFSGIASKLTTNLAFNPWLSKCKIASVEKAVTPEEPSGEHTELTFSDFGIADQSFTGTTTGVKGVLPSTQTSWDKVIFTGELEVTKHIGTHFLFGGKDTAGDYTADSQGLILEYRTDGQLLLRWQNSSSNKGAEYLLFASNLLTNQGFDMLHDSIVFRVQFDYAGEDVTVSVTADNGIVSATDTATFAGIASKMTGNMVFNPWVSDCSIASVEKTVIPEEPSGEYTELTFSDFEIADQSFTGTTTGVKGVLPSTQASWDKVIFTGELEVTKHIGTHFLFGGKDTAGDYTADSQGLILEYRTDGQLLLRWQNSSSNKGAEYLLFASNLLTNQGFDMLHDSIVFRVQFDYAGEDVTVSVTVDNGTVSATDTATFAGIASKMTGNMVFNPWVSDCKISSVGEDVEPAPGPGTDPEPGPGKTYTQLTFSDFGIASQVFGGGTTGVLGIAPTEVTSLDGIIFSGQIKISYHLDEHFLIGGADGALDYNVASPGIILSQASDGMLIIRSQFDGVKGAEFILFDENTPVSQGFNMLEDVIAFDMQFDYQGDDVTVTVTLDNGTVSVTDSATLSGIASKLSTNVVFNPWLSACKIASIGEDINGEGGSEKEPDEVTEFTELTFNSFRIKDNDYLNNIIYGTPLSYVKDFDKVAFSGYVVLAEESSSVRIACGENSLEGLMLAYDAAGKQLILSDQSGAGRGDIFKVTEEEAGIKFVENEFKFRLTFDFYGDGNVRLRMYINDTLYGKTTLPMYSSYLKNNVILLAGTHIAVRSTEGAEEYELTPWEEFIRSKVIFEYFGFTDNWDKEMDEGI